MINFSPELLVNLACAIVGAYIATMTYKRSAKKDIEQDAKWRATVDTTLKSVDANTQRILDSLDRSDARIGGLERDVAVLKKDVSTLYDIFEGKK